MNKLELAHEYAKVLLQQPVTRTIGDVVSISFGLAEEMLAENKKREDKSRPEVLIYPEFDVTVNYPDYAEVKFNGYIMKAGMAKILFNNMVKIK
ncbi:hypothetical protein [Acinetobacter phage BUCT628]|nr:hypothetical protein [Acinetobacter phage BUCT628]